MFQSLGAIIRTSRDFREEWHHMSSIQRVIGAVFEAPTLLVFPIFGTQDFACFQNLLLHLLIIYFLLLGPLFLLRFAHLFDELL